MILTFLKKLFSAKVTPIIDEKTERVFNIIYPLEDKSLEGYLTNSVFRIKNHQHELDLIQINEGYCIEAVTAIATPLTCPLNKFHHEHGCYSAE